MDNFDFNIGNRNSPIVNITTIGLSFNHAVIAALGYPEYVNIGLDKENKRLAIKAVKQNDNDNARHYRFVVDEKSKKYISLAASKIRNELVKVINAPYMNNIRLLAAFNSDKQMLIVDLNQKF